MKMMVMLTNVLTAYYCLLLPVSDMLIAKLDPPKGYGGDDIETIYYNLHTNFKHALSRKKFVLGNGQIKVLVVPQLHRFVH